ncbi:hypothetical protein AX14_006754 [Amanita brunnescens Koide BX004]|nr:hypothetical protein AX14_006754 [Amanita brunnescens Koide BX004]
MNRAKLVKKSKFIDRRILEKTIYAKRQVNVIVKASKRQTGVSLARSVRGRLPEEVWKYLNIFRKRGIEVNQNHNYPNDEELWMDDPRYVHITKLKLGGILLGLLKDQQLAPRLRSLQKPSKSASVGMEKTFLLKIILADTGLYEFLTKVASVTGGAPGEEDAGDREVTEM